jgi:hypothetical protein
MRALLSLSLCWMLGCQSEPPASGRCTRDDECPGGQRCADGVCTPTVKTDSGPTRIDLARVPDGRPGEATPAVPDLRRGDGLGQCKANHDDKLERDEMPIVVGAKIKYLVGSGIAVDLKGTEVGGRTRWDLTVDASDDHAVVAELLPVPGWAAASYPGATYSSLLDEGYQSYGVFKATPSALQMIGVVSQQPDKIKLAYSKPVELLRFPIAAKDSFVTDASVTGWFGPLGVYLYNLETYSVDVLGVGELKVPQLTLDVLLVRVKVEQVPCVYPVGPCNPFLATTRVQFMFVSECYGIVGQVVAESDPGDKLSSVKAKERKRITL